MGTFLVQKCSPGDQDIRAVFHSHETAHIYSITHPGIMLSHDALGYTCVGSGGPHATYNLIGSSYKKSLPMDEVEGILLEAKNKAEVAPEVGKETTIIKYKNNNGGRQ